MTPCNLNQVETTYCPDVMNSQQAVIHVVDDDAGFRTAIARLLGVSGYRVTLYESASQALNTLPSDQRGCILLDVRMPGLSGMQLQKHLTRLQNPLPIIFLTGHGDIMTSVLAIKAGAEDFLTKPVTKKTLLNVIERALAHYDDLSDRTTYTKSLRTLFESLSEREREVFMLVVRGQLNKQIAHRLGIAERTVKAHRHNVMEKMRASSVAELVSIAGQLGHAIA
jgi:FixJ family two-component response regulator